MPTSCRRTARTRSRSPATRGARMTVGSFGINLNSDNPACLTTFYRDVLGLEMTEWGGFTVNDLCILTVDAHEHVHGQTKEPARVLVNFFVDDLAAEQARLEAAGVTFIRTAGVEPWGGVISTFL